MILARKSEDILLGMSADAAFFGIMPDGVGMVGAGLVLGCIIFSTVRILLKREMYFGASCVWKKMAICSREDE